MSQSEKQPLEDQSTEKDEETVGRLLAKILIEKKEDEDKQDKKG